MRDCCKCWFRLKTQRKQTSDCLLKHSTEKVFLKSEDMEVFLGNKIGSTPICPDCLLSNDFFLIGGGAKNKGRKRTAGPDKRELKKTKPLKTDLETLEPDCIYFQANFHIPWKSFLSLTQKKNTHTNTQIPPLCSIFFLQFTVTEQQS